MTQWEGKTRGGVIGYKIFVFIIKYFGVSVAYFFLKIVALYFLLSASKAYKAIFYYFNSIHSYSKTRSFFSTYKNFCLLGKVLVDKIALLSGISHKFTYNFEGENYLRQLAQEKTGGILVNAHIGNWEIAGQLLERLETRINILMFDAEHEKIKQYLSNVLEQKNVGFIIIKDGISHLEQIRDALLNKEIIAMNGDRFMPGNRTISCNFMGKEAEFPVSPFYMAGKYNVPVVYVFAMKETTTHYHFYASAPHKLENFGNLKSRDATLKCIVNEYVGELEKMIKKYPLQWFNYYNFWKQ
ncbi:MAG: lipid A biosynthesis acyltransferase [Bacteroidota bacterium]